MTDRKARKERPAILAPDRLEHRPPDPLRHLSAVAEVTRRSQQIALAALHEALTQPSRRPGSPYAFERVQQLRRVTEDMDREVGRLEDAMDELAPDADFNPSGELKDVEGELRDGRIYGTDQATELRKRELEDAPIVREDDPPVRSAETQKKVEGLQRVARMASGSGRGMPMISGLLARVVRLADDLAKEYPVTGEDALSLGRELAEAGDIQGLRDLGDLLLQEGADPKTYGLALDVCLYGPVRARKDTYKAYYPKT